MARWHIEYAETVESNFHARGDSENTESMEAVMMGRSQGALTGCGPLVYATVLDKLDVIPKFYCSDGDPVLKYNGMTVCM